MSKANTFENEVLLLVFNSTLTSHLGTLSGSGNANLYVALHTADPGESGSFAAECVYGSYARQAVARSSAGWTVSGNTASNTATISFPECSSGSETVTYVSIANTSTGSGTMLYSGALNASRLVSSGITLQFAASALTVTED